jgi:hypothetical protein
VAEASPPLPTRLGTACTSRSRGSRCSRLAPSVEIACLRRCLWLATGKKGHAGQESWAVLLGLCSAVTRRSLAGNWIRAAPAGAQCCCRQLFITVGHTQPRDRLRPGSTLANGLSLREPGMAPPTARPGSGLLRCRTCRCAIPHGRSQGRRRTPLSPAHFHWAGSLAGRLPPKSCCRQQLTHLPASLDLPTVRRQLECAADCTHMEIVEKALAKMMEAEAARAAARPKCVCGQPSKRFLCGSGRGRTTEAGSGREGVGWGGGTRKQGPHHGRQVGEALSLPASRRCTGAVQHMASCALHHAAACSRSSPPPLFSPLSAGSWSLLRTAGTCRSWSSSWQNSRRRLQPRRHWPPNIWSRSGVPTAAADLAANPQGAS